MSSLESLIDRIYQHGVERESVSLVTKWTGGSEKAVIWSCLQKAWIDRIDRAIRDDRIEPGHRDKLFVWQPGAADSLSFLWADLGMQPDGEDIHKVWTSVKKLPDPERATEGQPIS